MIDKNIDVIDKVENFLFSLKDSKDLVPMEVTRDGYDGKRHWKVKYLNRYTGTTYEFKVSQITSFFDKKEGL